MQIQYLNLSLYGPLTPNETLLWTGSRLDPDQLQTRLGFIDAYGVVHINIRNLEYVRSGIFRCEWMDHFQLFGRPMLYMTPNNCNDMIIMEISRLNRSI